MKAFLCARVSTANGQKPEMQLAELRDYCARRGFDVAGEFVDAGIGGGKERRPQLDAMLTGCRKRQVKCSPKFRQVAKV